MAEHSPIRCLTYSWTWEELKSWVSVHLVRHKIGTEHFVETQRTDRRTDGVDRDNAPQNALVIHSTLANAQAIINISRKRLCKGATAPETRAAWQEMITELAKMEPMLAEVCVPECIYRGYCYEIPIAKKGCQYSLTETYRSELERYRKIE